MYYLIFIWKSKELVCLDVSVHTNVYKKKLAHVRRYEVLHKSIITTISSAFLCPWLCVYKVIFIGWWVVNHFHKMKTHLVVRVIAQVIISLVLLILLIMCNPQWVSPILVSHQMSYDDVCLIAYVSVVGVSITRCCVIQLEAVAWLTFTATELLTAPQQGAYLL